MDTINIKELIPHRPPMLLVDEVIEIDAVTKSITARKTIRSDEFFLQGHYPEFPLVPGVISCECIFQTAAVLLAYMFKGHPKSNQKQIPVIAKIKNAKFIEMIRPEDEVILRAEVYEQVGPAFFLRGSASVKGKTCVKVEFVCMGRGIET